MRKKRLTSLGIIGNPISHSLSPLMQNAALSHLKMPWLYIPFKLKKSELGNFFNTMRKKNIKGVNVTVPYKEECIPYLDSLTREARLIGAVNTVEVEGKSLVGSNTDGRGYITSLKRDARFTVKGKQVNLIGAGGAAKAIAVMMGLSRAREVNIFNRSLKKAHDLAAYCQKKFPNTAYTALPLTHADPYLWSGCDLLINATSMGMKGVPLAPLPLGLLRKKALVSDIVTTPLKTPLLKKADKLHLKTHAGWGMLLYQGALSFQKWTGRTAPVEVMKKALLDALYD